MRYLLLLLGFVVFSDAFSQKKNTEPYFPAYNNWQQKKPAEMGLNATKIAEAISFAVENESKNPRNMEVSHYQSFGKEPFGFGIGPFAER